MIFTGITGLVMLLLSGSGVPLGMPPAPEDPTIFRAAPEECLWYLGWAGTAEPDPNSKNHTEQLLAEQEVQHFLTEVETQLVAALKRGAPPNEEGRVAAEHGPKLVKALFTRPAAIFVASAGVGLSGPMVNGGAIVNLGDQAKDIEASLKTIERLATGRESTPDDAGWRRLPLPPQVPVVEWGVKGKHLVVGIGKGSADGIAERVTGDSSPAWLEEVRKNSPVERLSTLHYLNLRTIREIAVPMLSFGTGRPINGQAILDLAGIGNVQYYSNVSGLDEDGCVSKTFVALDGDPKGFLTFIGGAPLSADDISSIPDDATVAFAVRIDPQQILSNVRQLASTLDPRAAAELQDGIDDLKEDIGIDIEKDVLASLGDVWCIYDSPRESGLLLGATALVSVTDRDSLTRANERMVTLIRAEGGKDRARGQRGRQRFVTVGEFDFEGERVFFLNVVGEDFPFAPAWVITKDKLVIGLFPQTIKAYLSRSGDSKTLADAPAIASLLEAESAPVAIAYYDSRRIVELTYPGLQMLANVACSMLQSQGVELDISALPSLGTISKHLSPGTMSLSHAEGGIAMVSRSTLPISAGPATLALPLVGIASTRATIQPPRRAAMVQPSTPARPLAIGGGARGRSMNNLKQIGLALHNFHDVNKSLPAAFTVDKAGKPLLSWRVQVLPFLGDEGAKLHREFKHNEPWDSEHNKKLIEKMPAAYQVPGQKKTEAGKTSYLAPRGTGTLLSGEKPVGFRDALDGLSLTIMVVEAGPDAAVIWTKPDDLDFNPDKPLEGLLGQQDGGFLALFGDGSVRMIKDSVDPETLRRLFDRKDGQPVDRNSF